MTVQLYTPLAVFILSWRSNPNMRMKKLVVAALILRRNLQHDSVQMSMLGLACRTLQSLHAWHASHDPCPTGACPQSNPHREVLRQHNSQHLGPQVCILFSCSAMSHSMCHSRCLLGQALQQTLCIAQENVEHAPSQDKCGLVLPGIAVYPDQSTGSVCPWLPCTEKPDTDILAAGPAVMLYCSRGTSSRAASLSHIYSLSQVCLLSAMHPEEPSTDSTVSIEHSVLRRHLSSRCPPGWCRLALPGVTVAGNEPRRLLDGQHSVGLQVHTLGQHVLAEPPLSCKCVGLLIGHQHLPGRGRAELKDSRASCLQCATTLADAELGGSGSAGTMPAQTKGSRLSQVEAADLGRR